MSRFMLHHQHLPEECAAVFMSFKGYDSSLRRRNTVASCLSGAHAVWWVVEASGEEEALRLLPDYVAARTVAILVSEVEIP